VRSTLGYALLALLARAPGSGYELGTRVRRPLGYFWSAQHSQIHGELQRLLADELVRFEQVAGPGPRDKKIYSISGTGRDALARWVAQPPNDQPARDELLLKAYAMWIADRDAVRELLLAQIDTREQRIESYQQDWRRVEGRHGGAAPPFDHPDFGSYATLKYGIDYERHRIAWCRWMLARLDEGNREPEREIAAASAATPPATSSD
jgi:DNA-binding PadR family transcriptional regulator